MGSIAGSDYYKCPPVPVIESMLKRGVTLVSAVVSVVKYDLAVRATRTTIVHMVQGVVMNVKLVYASICGSGQQQYLVRNGTRSNVQ